MGGIWNSIVSVSDHGPFMSTFSADEALPGVLGIRETWPFISGEHGNKGLKMRGT